MRPWVLAMSAVAFATLCGCGGSGGGLATTPPPVPTPAPTPTPTPAPTPTPTPTGTNFNTAEYQRSNAAVQAQALGAYNAGATGQGVTVAVIDSGIDTRSAEFAGRISSASADLASTRGLQDEGGHGTAVASVLLGAKNDRETHGVAFNATLLVARTDTPGSCANNTGPDSGCSHADNAIARGVDLAVAQGARVINMSLGGSPPNSTLRAAIGRATAAGIVIVISAGNDGEDNPAAAVNPDPFAQIALDPLARGQVLIVGATQSSQALAAFSNRAGNGQQFYLTALGNEVRAPDENGTAFLWSGTSFSTPIVAGAAALLAQAFPNLTGAQIADLLLRTATDLGTTGTDATFGRGELNIARAFAPQGQATVGKTAVPVSLINNGTLSAPMGDAGQTGALTTAIRDGYGRDYVVDLAPTLTRAPREVRLASALAEGGQQLGAALGARTTLAVSVAREQPQRLLLDRRELRLARALAATVSQRIGRDTQLAFAFASGSAGLDRALSGARSPAFLVTDAQDGLARAPLGAFALRQRIGGIQVSLAAETGDLRLWQRGQTGPRSDGYRNFGYGAVTLSADAKAGPLALTTRLTRMSERETVLGARFGPGLGGGGAVSWFADISARAEPLRHWSIGATLRRGWTAIGAGAVRGQSVLQTQALALDVARTALLVPGDSLALRYAEPLRVSGGGLSLTGVDGPLVLGLAPAGRERDLEAVYARPLARGALSLNSFWRRQPGNVANAPDDLGGALRYRVEF